VERARAARGASSITESGVSVARMDMELDKSAAQDRAIDLAAVSVGTPTVLGDSGGDTVWSAIRKTPVAPGTPCGSRSSISPAMVKPASSSTVDPTRPCTRTRRNTWRPGVVNSAPCYKLALHLGRSDIQQRMRRSGRTGWYLRVLEPGAVPADGPIERIRHDLAGLSVAEAHAAMTDRHLENIDLVTALAADDRLAAEWREPLRERLSRRT